MKTLEPLLYHGKEMDFSSAKYEDDVTTPAQTAAALRSGLPAQVRLQPGDGTRYDFYLIPVKFNTKFALTYGLTQRDFVYIGPVNIYSRKMHSGDRFIPLSSIPGESMFSLRNVYENEWTCTVIAYYLALVAREMGIE